MSMKTSGQWITNILAAVVCGACLRNACGLRAQPSFSPTDEMNGTNRVTQIVETLGLTDDQKAKVEPILQAGFDKQHAILESFRDQPHNRRTLRSLRSQLRATEMETANQLKPILTDQQMTQYEQIRNKMNARMRQQIRSYRNNAE